MQVEEAIVSSQGLRLWYKVSGNGPICIMPTSGWGPNSDIYFQTLVPLEALFTLVYLDTRGTARSERPMQSSVYTYDQFAASSILFYLAIDLSMRFCQLLTWQ